MGASSCHSGRYRDPCDLGDTATSDASIYRAHDSWPIEGGERCANAGCCRNRCARSGSAYRGSHIEVLDQATGTRPVHGESQDHISVYEVTAAPGG